QVSELTSVLQSVLAAEPFQLEQLVQDVTVAPFNPGNLYTAVVMPDHRTYQVPPLTGLRALSSAARREHQEASQRAQAQFEHDCRIAQQSEEKRRKQLDAHYRKYQIWANSERQKIVDYNEQVAVIGRQMALGDPASIREFFTAALYASTGWPES